jgi:hypothetical protein
MDGVIVDIDGDHAAVEISLRSLEIIAVLPKIFLEINLDSIQSDDKEEPEKPAKKPFSLDISKDDAMDDLLILSIGDCASKSPKKNININDVRTHLAKRLSTRSSETNEIKAKAFQRLEKEFKSKEDGLVSFKEGMDCWTINDKGWDRYVQLKEMENAND